MESPDDLHCMDCIPQSSALNMTFHFQCDEMTVSQFYSIFNLADMFLHNIECKSAKYFRNSYFTPQCNAPDFIFQMQCDAWTRNNYSHIFIFLHHIDLISNAILKLKVYYPCPACSRSMWLNFHHRHSPLMLQTEVHIWVICPLGSVHALNASIHSHNQ